MLGLCLTALCKSAFKKGGIYCTGTLQRCVEMPIKWQDDDGNVFEYPVFDYSQFNSDETDYNVVYIGEGKRKLTQNNSTSMFYDKGLVVITVIEDQYNSAVDNLSEWICDYKKPESKPPLLEWNGGGQIRLGRSRRVWVDTDKPVEWSVSAGSGVEYAQNDNSVKISVPLDESLIGSVVRVAAVVDGEKSECEFEIVGGV